MLAIGALTSGFKWTPGIGCRCFDNVGQCQAGNTSAYCGVNMATCAVCSATGTTCMCNACLGVSDDHAQQSPFLDSSLLGSESKPLIIVCPENVLTQIV